MVSRKLLKVLITLYYKRKYVYFCNAYPYHSLSQEWTEFRSLKILQQIKKLFGLKKGWK